MKIETLSIQDIKQGYLHDTETNKYSCLVCGKIYETGEVYQIEGRLFEAPKAITKHMESEHSDYMQRLINGDSKYNSLTENQKQLFQMFASDIGDKEIAKELGISASTVRHQKFIFREKAKQAKFYLAMYERVFENKDTGENNIIPIHEHAKMVDERYVMTEQERSQILQSVFISLSPLKLKVFPPKEKKKLAILTKIAEQFEQSKEYSEKQVNNIIGEIYDDFVTIRRYLIEYGFMKRTRDGSKYWLT